MRIWTGLALWCVAGTVLAQDDVTFLTVTSTDGKNVVEWQNPAGPYGFTRVIGRTDRFPNAPDDIDLGSFTFVADLAGVQGMHDSVPHEGLTNGSTYFYAVFVNDGLGSFSSGKRARGRPMDTSGPVKWCFLTGSGTTAMAAPGIGSTVLATSNDNNVYAMTRGVDGGTWPPGFTPLSMTGPAQHRPGVVPVSGVTSADNFSLIAAQDGFVRAVDTDGGDLLWTSSDFGVLQAAPAAWFVSFGGTMDLALVGTRNAGADNIFLALDASNGGTQWSFSDPGGTGIGIVNGGASVDYANSRVYFTSFERNPGADTVWALDLASGSKLWSRAVGRISGSAIQRGEFLYLGADDGLVYALHTDDGAVKINFPFDTADKVTKGFVFPDFFGDALYLSTETTVWSLRDVEPVVIEEWSHSGIPNPSVPVYPPGSRYLWVGSSDGHLYQLDVATGNPAQPPVTTSIQLGEGAAGVGSPSFDVVHRLIYVGTEDGAIYAVQAPF